MGKKVTVSSIKSIIGIGVRIKAIRKNINLIQQCKRCQVNTQSYYQNISTVGSVMVSILQKAVF